MKPNTYQWLHATIKEIDACNNKHKLQIEILTEFRYWRELP